MSRHLLSHVPSARRGQSVEGIRGSSVWSSWEAAVALGRAPGNWMLREQDQCHPQGWSASEGCPSKRSWTPRTDACPPHPCRPGSGREREVVHPGAGGEQGDVLPPSPLQTRHLSIYLPHHPPLCCKTGVVPPAWSTLQTWALSKWPWVAFYLKLKKKFY